MTPKWLQSRDDGGRRMSMMSSITSRREVMEIETDVPPVPTLPSSTSSTDGTAAVEPSSSQIPPPSRRRLSLFGRNASHPSTDPDPVPELPPFPQGLPVHEDAPPSTSTDPKRASLFHRKKPSKSFRPLNAQAEPILRWIRGEDRHVDPFSPPAAESEDDFYRNLKKASISPPFNFQHVTHTQQNQLPKLESVNDRELVMEFWASSAQQMPQSDLRGIRAEDIDAEQRIAKNHAHSPTSQRTSPDSSRLFSNGPLRGLTQDRAKAESVFDSSPMSGMPKDYFGHVSRPSTSPSATPLTDRSVSLASLRTTPISPPSTIHPALRNQSACPSMPELSRKRSSSNLGTPSADHDTTLQAVPEELETASTQASPVRRREQPPDNSADQWRSSIRSSAEPPALDSSFDSATTSDWHSPALQHPWKTSFSTLCSRESWEDDVDFCYLVEAESTCHFDWTPRANSITDNEARGYGLPTPPKLYIDDEGSEAVSPRSSIIHHHRAKSSMTMQLLDFPLMPTDSKTGENPTSTNLEPGPLLPKVHSVSPLTNPWPASDSLDSLPLDNNATSSETEVEKMETPRPLKATLARNLGRFRSSSVENFKQTDRKVSHARRWSSQIPSSLTEAVGEQKLSFLASTFPAGDLEYEPSRSPPQAPLPALPKPQTHAVPMIPPKSVSDDAFMRRPSTPQDRMILQAAGRVVQSGRGSRPTTPRRVSPRMDTPGASASRDAMARSESVPNLQGSTVLSGPMPPLPLSREFPAWI